MSNSEDLIASGLLYGSNYNDWKISIDAKLRMHGLELFATQFRSPYNEDYSKEEWTEKSAEAANVIRVEVTFTLLRRVPEGEIKNAKRLMNRLEALATRFRFLDLPAELRNRVYGYLIDSEHNNVICPRKRCQTQYSAVTKASMQLRKESLPIMYARSTFRFDFTVSSGEVTSEYSISTAIQKWSSRQDPSQLKLLRHVVIKDNFRKQYTKDVHAKNIKLWYSKKDGFSAQPYGVAFIRESQELFQEHMKATESIRQMFSMQGEIIILALISHPRLWKSGNLKVKAS